ncbi:uncharacterized protein MYCFIDRAFT_83071 [Pseudocercospora fijiensis CIRAD86]|uniref:Uncharacterized protein n=1 Tax=Pseudocercospora fijiensis (strain CIRAD86) TaxID=383855 RepID=M3A1I6_PSEFD|nr:uncharacterized protein MYCFIDRAFT_83071 [Pseudocercospora fijiensis CIRAD86]EME85039.1 hypothetical protein MYCFIDRAFT_83071 [Pseudocercospora fijiensis CIRAD86]
MQQTEKMSSSKDEEIAQLRDELSQINHLARRELDERDAYIQTLVENGRRIQNDHASTVQQLQVAREKIAEQESLIASLRSEYQNFSDTKSNIEQGRTSTLEIQQGMQSTTEGLKNEVEFSEARFSQAENIDKPDVDMEDASGEDQNEKGSAIDDSGFFDMDTDDKENALELSSPQADRDSQARRTPEKPVRTVKSLSLETVQYKQISKKGEEKFKKKRATPLKRFVTASEKPKGEQTSKDIKSAEAMQQIVQDHQAAEKAKLEENINQIMHDAVRFFREGEYQRVPYNRMLCNAEKTEFVLSIQREAAQQPCQARVTEKIFDRNMESLLLLPLPETLDDENAKKKFALACLYAQIPDVQADAAKSFLTEEEYTAYCNRCFSNGKLNAPLSCKQNLSCPSKKWEEVVNTLSTYKRFQTAARFWANGEKASNELQCWPPTFLDVEKQESCTIYQDQAEWALRGLEEIL